MILASSATCEPARLAESSDGQHCYTLLQRLGGQGDRTHTGRHRPGVHVVQQSDAMTDIFNLAGVTIADSQRTA